VTETFGEHAGRLATVEAVARDNQQGIRDMDQKLDNLVSIAARQTTLLEQILGHLQREAEAKAARAEARRQAIKRVYTDAKAGVQAVWRVIKKPFGVVASLVAGWLSLKYSGQLPPELGGDDDPQTRKGQETAPQNPDAAP